MSEKDNYHDDGKYSKRFYQATDEIEKQHNGPEVEKIRWSLQKKALEARVPQLYKKRSELYKVKQLLEKKTEQLTTEKKTAEEQKEVVTQKTNIKSRKLKVKTEQLDEINYIATLTQLRIDRETLTKKLKQLRQLLQINQHRKEENNREILRITEELRKIILKITQIQKQLGTEPDKKQVDFYNTILQEITDEQPRTNPGLQLSTNKQPTVTHPIFLQLSRELEHQDTPTVESAHLDSKFTQQPREKDPIFLQLSQELEQPNPIEAQSTMKITKLANEPSKDDSSDEILGFLQDHYDIQPAIPIKTPPPESLKQDISSPNTQQTTNQNNVLLQEQLTTLDALMEEFLHEEDSPTKNQKQQRQNKVNRLRLLVQEMKKDIQQPDAQQKIPSETSTVEASKKMNKSSPRGG